MDVANYINICLDGSSSLIAEIMWVLKWVMNGHSNNSNSKMNATFRAMFPDSNIAKHYQMSLNELDYMVIWGLGPYFKEILVEDIDRSRV